MTLYLTKALRLQDFYPEVEINDLEEMNSMLLSKNWKKICRQEMREEIIASRMKGRQEGLEKGLEEGKVKQKEVLKKILTQLLDKQAPHLLDAYQTLIEHAEITDLQAWLELAIKGETLEGLFGCMPSDY